MIDWRIYYGDGSTCSSAEAKPEEAPGLNVQAIVQADPNPHGNGRTVHRLYDFYIWDAGLSSWIGVDQWGLFDFLLRQGMVKFGRMIPAGRYREIVKAATDDPDFNPRPPSPGYEG